MIDFSRGFDEGHVSKWTNDTLRTAVMMGFFPRQSVGVGRHDIYSTIGTVVDTLSVGDCEGDHIVILCAMKPDRKQRWGFLVDGYGSCSGCDSFCAALEDYGPGRDPDAMTDYRNRLAASVLWFRNPEDLAKYMVEEKDWGGSHLANDSVADILSFILKFARAQGVDFREAS